MANLQQGRFDYPRGPLPEPMAKSQGTGLALLKRGPFAADLIRFAPGQGVAEHTHPGDHMLFVVSGWGRLVYSGETYLLAPGDCYLVPGAIRHAVCAADHAELTLISVANDHRPVANPNRLELTDAT